MVFAILDMETDGFLNQVTKIHCVSYQLVEGGKRTAKKSITSAKDIKELLSRDYCFAGHNLVRFDFPVLEKVLRIQRPKNFMDTLGLSWYLYSYYDRHGLEAWGNRLGFPKPEIDDWQNLSEEEYIHRCEGDVEINTRLFFKFYAYLLKIYDGVDQVFRLVNYLNYKLDCLFEQETVGISLDEDRVHELILKFEYLVSQKRAEVSSVMPNNLGRVIKPKPKVPYRKDGSLSSHGQKWFEYLRENNLPENTEVVREEPNPSSHVQIKQWLFDSGWEPITFKESKATGEMVPQVMKGPGEGLCESVAILAEQEPGLWHLEGLGVLVHRLGIFRSYAKYVENGRVYATAHGFTNTLRLQHASPIVNLPKVDKDYGEEVRGCLIASEGYLLCGCDISGLESATADHYIYQHDPDYVREKRTPGFDPHLDIALLAGMLSEAQIEDHKLYKKTKGKQGVDYSSVRHAAKTTNFASKYLAGPAKIAATAKISLEEGMQLHATYWERNWAEKIVAQNLHTKEVNKKLWLLNPISGLYYYLKYEKDRFSTLNQGSGVYVFDIWLREVRSLLRVFSIPVIMQYHDEIVVLLRKDQKELVEHLLKVAILRANEILSLNVTVAIDIQFGKRYSEIH